jgi:hypothetical protein
MARVMLKSGDKVLVRDDNGEFTVPGVVVKRMNRTITVNYGRLSQNLGVFNLCDVKKTEDK